MSKKNDVKAVKLTPELKEKLSGYLVSSKGIIISYVPDILKELPEGFIPTFKIRTMTIAEKKDYDIAEHTDESLSRYVALHVMGWDNLYDFSFEEPPIVDYEGDGNGCEYELFDSTIPPFLKIDLLKCLLHH